MVAAIVLAAGSSTRLGHPKQNAVVGTETLLERTMRVAQAAGFAPVFVVLSPGLVPELAPRTHILINDQAREGIASSIRVGISAAINAAADGAVILVCDQPSVTEEHLRHLASRNDEVVASSYAGRKGVPAYFPARIFGELLALRGDAGAREILRDAQSIPLNKGELDVDTSDDLRRARELYAIDPPFRADRG